MLRGRKVPDLCGVHILSISLTQLFILVMSLLDHQDAVIES